MSDLPASVQQLDLFLKMVRDEIERLRKIPFHWAELKAELWDRLREYLEVQRRELQMRGMDGQRIE